MIGRGLFILTILSNCVLSLPVTSSQLENEDVKVMKCIVEALADVLSRPHPMPVSQECLVTLKTDDRLVTILRHHNFLKELQEIAVQGSQERAQLPRGAGILDHVTETPQTTDDAVDRSMLEALGGPGERSILSQKRRTANGDREEEKDESLGDGESQEEMQAKRENDENPRSHVSESADDWGEGTAEKREEEEDEYEEKREHSEENSEEENMTEDKKGAGSDEKRDSPRNTSKEKKFDNKDEEEKDKRSALFSHKLEDKEEEPQEEEDEGEMKRGNRESLKRWTKRAKGLALKKKAVGKEVQELNSQQEVPHHSKEVTEEDVVRKKKSPEEKELQMIARRAPEERRGSEEEGSASRKSEEPEIESLAAIESELENVAQKLHELRRG